MPPTRSLVAAGIAAAATALLGVVLATGALPRRADRPQTGPAPGGWVMQLQRYRPGTIDALGRAPQRLIVLDLARDADTDYFTAADTDRLHRAGKTVLAYFEIGSIETFRPEYPGLLAERPDLLLNRWPTWPDERFVRYWEPGWWERVLRGRVDQAVRAGFDGVYLDTPLAYDEIDLDLVPGYTRDSLGRLMVDLISRLSRYGRSQRPGLLVVPQNSPELRRHPGFVDAIDGIGIEELFFLATDRPCDSEDCAANLRDVRALRAAGKTVLAVDYATRAGNIRTACARYRSEGFTGYVSTVDLDRISPSC